MGMTAAFTATVSSEEVPRGKPYPDVYLEAARRLGRSPGECLAVEDSANGIRAAVAAGLVVVAVPNREFPPPDDVLGQADVVLERLPQLTVELVLALEGDTGRRRDDLLDEEEDESFPASDPHSDWAGPPD